LSRKGTAEVFTTGAIWGSLISEWRWLCWVVVGVVSLGMPLAWAQEAPDSLRYNADGMVLDLDNRTMMSKQIREMARSQSEAVKPIPAGRKYAPPAPPVRWDRSIFPEDRFRETPYRRFFFPFE
jgi:hypothetical protein